VRVTSALVGGAVLRRERRGEREARRRPPGLARRWDITPSQLALGWALGKQPQFVPTLGMRTLQQLDEAIAARPLTSEQLAEVEAVAPRGAVAGTRYPASQMAFLDREKR